MTYPVKSIKVSHDILEVLVERGSAGVTELATALDCPKSTVHDHLRSLAMVGYVVNEDGRYRLGTKLHHLGETARNNHVLYRHGQAEALTLSDNVEGKHVQLVTEEHGQCTVLFGTGRRESGPQPAHTYPPNVTFHSNAPGKAILAHRETADIDRYLAERDLAARTANTITDPDRLRAALETIRDRGYAVDAGELIAGMHGVAAPVVTDAGVHGAVAVYSSADRFDGPPGSTPACDEVQETARSIEANLIFSEE